MAAMELEPDPILAAGGGCALGGRWGAIRAVGPDAAAFLQSQLTQEVAKLGPADARLAGYCSPKGRLLATFVVWQPAAQEYLLACSADLLPATLKRLAMYVLRAKCRLTDASAELALHGLAGASALQWLQGAAPAAAWQLGAAHGGWAIRLPDAAGGIARLLWAAPSEAGHPELPALDAQAWAWLEVRSGVARIAAATADAFVPQMVNLELTGGVDFRKGCYPGQEVVARSQYRGTLKRRLHAFWSDAPLAAGDELFHSADPGQPAGQVVLAATWSGRHALLASVKTAVLEGGTLHAGAATLSPAALPYPVPAAAEA